MVKNRNEVNQDMLNMCGWVQDSYHLPKDFFLKQFHKMLCNLEEEMMQATTLDEYNDLRANVERTLTSMAQRHHLVEEYVYEREVE